MTVAPAGATVVPRPVVWSARSWLIAVAAGVLETVIQALTSEDYNVAAQLTVRAVVCMLAIVVIVQLRRGHGWARIVLTVVLGGLGLFSLLVEPVSWLLAGGAPGAFVGAADAPTLAVILLRTAHVVAVLAALVLMYRPAANRFFRSRRSY